MKYSLCYSDIYAWVWGTRQTNFKRRVQDRIGNSSSICCHLSVLASLKRRLYLCFCLLSRWLPPLQRRLETVGSPHATPRKTKNQDVWFIFALRTWQMKNRGGERKHSRQRRQLWNLGEPTATNLGFTGAQWCTVGSRGGALLCFRRKGGEWEKMAGNEVGGLWSIGPSCSQ